MIGKRIIKSLVRIKIEPLLKNYIKNEQELNEAVNGIADTVVFIIDTIGWRETIKWINFAKKINLLKVKNEHTTRNS